MRTVEAMISRFNRGTTLVRETQFEEVFSRLQHHRGVAFATLKQTDNAARNQ